MKSVAQFPYEEVRARRGRCIHPARTRAQADVYEIEWEGQPAILKDFTGRPWLIRRVWGRLVAGREVRALGRLAGVQGVPRLIGWAGPEAFLMERLAARRLPKKGQPAPPDNFWLDLRRLFHELHGRGIAHGDLRRLNLMIDEKGQACVIDFATSISVRGAGGGVRGFLFERCRRIDRVTLARLKESYGEELLDEEDRTWLRAEPWYLRVGRFLKHQVLGWRKPRHWRRLWRRLRPRD